MSVLFLTQIMPHPLDAGPKVRAHYVLSHLARRHRATLLSFAREDDRPESEAYLAKLCGEVFTVPLVRSHRRDVASFAASAAAGQSFVIRRDYIPAMARKLDELLATGAFEYVHADQLWMAQYALRPRGGELDHRPKLVLDEHNACYRIFERLAQAERHPLKRLVLEREWRALVRYEAMACAQFAHVVTVTDEDQRLLRAQIERVAPRADGPRWSTIPICVDPREQTLVERSPGTRDVLHLGTMFFMPNVEGVLWFAREVWPRVHAEVPDATFTVAGKRPPRSVERLALADNGIRVIGYVADPLPYLRQAAVFIVPLHSGGGMRVKILDAWCWGIPIVSTRVGAEGIEYREGENILIADEPEAFAHSVIRVFQAPDLAQRLRENGRHWVGQHYDWRNVYHQWDQVYSSTRLDKPDPVPGRGYRCYDT